MSLEKAKEYLKNLCKYELFSRKCNKDDYEYLKKVEKFNQKHLFKF